MSHSKAPWSVEIDPLNAGIATLLDTDGNDSILRGDYTDWWVSTGNARRIVACVNACEGISTEVLERGPDNVFRYAKDLAEQRDELMAALERVIEWTDGESNMPADRLLLMIRNGARAAIQKAKGSARETHHQAPR